MEKRCRFPYEKKEAVVAGQQGDSSRGMSGHDKAGKDRGNRRDWCYRKLLK